MAPIAQLAFHQSPINVEVVESLREIPFAAVGDGHDDVRFLWQVAFTLRGFLS